ncbi:MAG: hypothetical protein MUF49_05215 [Oculatellaceae cyanobacterium Prado106]|nr:hypothetical protein [Oculatellaceae cyanobacterium Prado106]
MVVVSQNQQKAAKQTFIGKFAQKLFQYLSINYRCVMENPRLFLMRKIARLEVVRDVVCYFSRSTPSVPVSHLSSRLLQNLTVPTVVAALKEHGYCAGLAIPPDLIQEIREYADQATCYGDRNPKLPFHYPEKERLEVALNRKFQVGAYLDHDCTAIEKVIRDPGILAIAAQFLGTTPTYIASELLWSFPIATDWTQQLKAAQVLHYDIDDYRSIKFFFYLSDVDHLSGPHSCIRGSHRNKKLLHQLLGQRCASIPDEKLIAVYGGKDNVVTFCGSAGYGFVEDTFCLHRGNPPQQKERLMLQVEYAMNSYGNLRVYQS